MLVFAISFALPTHASAFDFRKMVQSAFTQTPASTTSAPVVPAPSIIQPLNPTPPVAPTPPKNKAGNLQKYMNKLDMISVTMAMLSYGVKTSDYTNGVTKCTPGDALTIQKALEAKFRIKEGTMWTRVIEQKENQLQAVIYAHKEFVVVAFRGSCGKNEGTYEVAGANTPIAKEGNSKNWKMNYNGASNVDERGFNAKATHRGWAHALNVKVTSEKNFYEEVAQWTRVALGGKDSSKYLLITGHSMGGALAHYFSYRFLDANKPWVPKAFTDSKEGRFVRTRILTFGAPKAGYGVCSGNTASIEVDYNRLLRDRQAWAASVEITDDPIPNSTNVSGTCPRTMGDRIVGANSMPGDAHDIRNYMLIQARNIQSSFGRLPYSDMYDPFKSWDASWELEVAQ